MLQLSLFRRNDKNAQIRILWTEFSSKLISNQPQHCNEIYKCLTEKGLDPEEKVRIAVIRVLSSIDATHFPQLSTEYLEAVGFRCRDKKVYLIIFFSPDSFFLIFLFF